MFHIPVRVTAAALAVAAIAGGIRIYLSARLPPEASPRLSRIALSSRYLAAGTSQGRLTVLDRDGAVLWRSNVDGPLNDLQFSPDGALLAVAATDLNLHSTDSPSVHRLLRSDHENYGTVRFTKDGTSLLVSTGKGILELLDPASGVDRFAICCSTIYGELAFTPKEQNIVNAGHFPRLWDGRSGKLLAEITTDREIETLGPIATDVSQGVMYMGSQDGRVYGWDLASRRLVAKSPGHPGWVDTVAVGSSGIVAYASFGKSLRLWNPQTGHEDSLDAALPTSNVVIASDDSLWFGTAAGNIEIWNPSEGVRLRRFNLSARR